MYCTHVLTWQQQQHLQLASYAQHAALSKQNKKMRIKGDFLLSENAVAITLIIVCFIHIFWHDFKVVFSFRFKSQIFLGIVIPNFNTFDLQ